MDDRDIRDVATYFFEQMTTPVGDELEKYYLDATGYIRRLYNTYVTNGDMSPKLLHSGVTLQFPGEAERKWKEVEGQMMEAPTAFRDWLQNRTSAD
ncbi:hypothetical protein RUND412_003818, partial [Rhizina undulata]